MSEFYNYLIGKTITRIEERSDEKGNEYLRLYLEDAKGSVTYYEHLNHFTPDEHKLHIAEQALEELYKGPYGGPTSYTASQALKKMKEFDR